MLRTAQYPTRHLVRHASTALQLATMLVALGLATRASAQQQSPPQPPQPTMSFTSGSGGKITGYILSRKGDQLLVKDETTKQIAVVTLTPTTVVESPTGVFKMDRKSQPDDKLIAGLLIEVKGDGGDRGDLRANKVKFRKKDYKVASQIAAGEVELKAKQTQTDMRLAAARDSLLNARSRARDSIEALNTRISNLDNFDVRSTSTVNFATNSAELSADAKRALDNLVTQTQGLDGFMIEVLGFADTTGNDQKNQLLSQARARAVVAYLSEAHAVPPRRIATPTGLGSARPVAPNDTPAGRALNRRVEIKLLVNRGVKPPSR
jgi:outer membrane protein OmpA-like peptidoglycan-associated protein